MQKQKDNGQQFNPILLAIISLFSLLVLSCAQISAPTGGKKDDKPPEMLIATPTNYSLNFHQKQIQIIFNEWIQPLQNAKNQIIVSPAIVPFPKIEAARNVLSIKLKDSLQANTTYSFFFGDNIKDNNEGNTLRDFKYVFSTGNFLDSLRVKGNVSTDLDKIPDNTYLLLYQEKEDSFFTRKAPFYISKIDGNGNFDLENVKAGDYRIYALSDKNGNYYFDLPNEAIGFTDSLYHLHQNMDSLKMTLFMQEDNLLRISDHDRVVRGGMMHITFNKELSPNKDQLSGVIPEFKEVTPIVFEESELNPTPNKGGSALVYFPKMPVDSASFSLVLENNKQLIDTLRIKIESRKFNKPILFFNDSISYKSMSAIEGKPLVLRTGYFSLSSIDTGRMILKDSTGQAQPFLVSREDDLRTYEFNADWKPGNIYHLILKDSALSDLAGNFNKQQEFSFQVFSAKKCGNLLINFELPKKDASYIVLLKDNSGKVSDRRILRDSQELKINYGLLLPGTYSAEVVDDVNDNGIRNSGNFSTKTLPERIYKEPKPIVVKENWDAEENIKVDFILAPKPSVPSLPNPDLLKEIKNGKGAFGKSPGERKE